MWDSWYFMVVAGLAISVLLIGALRAHWRLAIEQGKTPLYTQVSGGTIGWTSYRGPLIGLRIYDEFIVIGGWQRIVLRYDQIDRIELKSWLGLMTDRIQIVHHQPHTPKRIILGSSNPARLKELIDARLATAKV